MATTRRHDDETMRIHWEESATTKTAPFRLNPLGAAGFGPQALSGIAKAGHDGKTAPAASVSNLGGRSSLRACNPKTPARGPRDFYHGQLKGLPASSKSLLIGLNSSDSSEPRTEESLCLTMAVETQAVSDILVIDIVGRLIAGDPLASVRGTGRHVPKDGTGEF